MLPALRVAIRPVISVAALCAYGSAFLGTPAQAEPSQPTRQPMSEEAQPSPRAHERRKSGDPQVPWTTFCSKGQPPDGQETCLPVEIVKTVQTLTIPPRSITPTTPPQHIKCAGASDLCAFKRIPGGKPPPQ
jgi:hypothetical protein